MTIRAMLYKEFRAQAVVFSIALAALAAAAWWSGRGDQPLILLIYLNGVTILGAIAFGHEYSHHTMAVTLMQPVSRARIYLSKMSVLTVTVLMLAIATSVAARPWLSAIAMGSATALGIPLLGALGTAPFMSMIARSTIAGVFLTYGLNGAVMTGLILIAPLSMAPGSSVRDHAFDAMPAALAAAHGVMLVLTWRYFMRLEAVDAPVELKGFARFGTASAARHRRVWGALISKELHLQQVTVFMTAGLAALWVMIAVLTRVVPAWSTFPVGAMALVYVNSFAAIVGVTAIALEQRAGTHAMQLLQPVAAWQQWLVKILVAFTVSMVCGFILPVLAATLVHTEVTGEIAARMVMLAMFLVVAGVYLATLSTYPVIGVAMALPIALALGRLLQVVADLLRSPTASGPRAFLPGWALFFSSPVPVAILGAFILWLAFVNYSSDEPKLMRSLLQFGAIAIVASAVMIFVV
jgi:ABC-type transport system involved in multi-copper enzyme maturation permease subunit